MVLQRKSQVSETLWLSNIILRGGSQNGLIYGWWIPYLYAGLACQKIVGGPRLFKKALKHSWIDFSADSWTMEVVINCFIPQPISDWVVENACDHSWIFSHNALSTVPWASLPQLFKAALNCLQTCHKNILSNHTSLWCPIILIKVTTLSLGAAPAWNDA